MDSTAIVFWNTLWRKGLRENLSIPKAWLDILLFPLCALQPLHRGLGQALLVGRLRIALDLFKGRMAGDRLDFVRGTPGLSQ